MLQFLPFVTPNSCYDSHNSPERSHYTESCGRLDIQSTCIASCFYFNVQSYLCKPSHWFASSPHESIHVQIGHLANEDDKLIYDQARSSTSYKCNTGMYMFRYTKVPTDQDNISSKKSSGSALIMSRNTFLCLTLMHFIRMDSSLFIMYIYQPYNA